MTNRRGFLKAAGGAALLGPALNDARSLVRSGEIGPVRFCRVGGASFIPAVEFILGADWRDCVLDIDPLAGGAAFLGADATLVLDRGGCRLFARES